MNKEKTVFEYMVEKIMDLEDQIEMLKKDREEIVDRCETGAKNLVQCIHDLIDENTRLNDDLRFLRDHARVCRVDEDWWVDLDNLHIASNPEEARRALELFDLNINDYPVVYLEKVRQENNL